MFGIGSSKTAPTGGGEIAISAVPEASDWCNDSQTRRTRSCVRLPRCTPRTRRSTRPVFPLSVLCSTAPTRTAGLMLMGSGAGRTLLVQVRVGAGPPSLPRGQLHAKYQHFPDPPCIRTPPLGVRVAKHVNNNSFRCSSRDTIVRHLLTQVSSPVRPEPALPLGGWQMARATGFT